MNLFGPSRYVSLSGKYYAFVIVDDYSRYTWVLFLTNKDNAFDAFLVLEVIMVENLKIIF